MECFGLTLSVFVVAKYGKLTHFTMGRGGFPGSLLAMLEVRLGHSNVHSEWELH